MFVVASAPFGYVMGMATSDQIRAERLAAALRDNLRRRKAQARAAEGGATPGDRADAVPPADSA